MLDELTLVGGRPAALTKIVFERRQWTDPSAELDKNAPDDGWYVQPGEAWPARDEQATKDDEDNEYNMHQHDQVGGRTKDGRRID